MFHDHLRAVRCRRNRSSFAVSALLAGTLGAFSAATPAAADSWDVEVTSANSPLVTVESDGNDYNALKSGAPIQGTIRVMLDAESSGRVEFWSAWPMLGVSKEQDGYVPGWANFKTAGTDKTYNTPRPKKVDEEFNFSIPSQDYAATMVFACNTHAERLREDGMSNGQIFGSDRWIQVAISAGINYHITGIGSDTPTEVSVWENYKKVNVICQASEPLDPVTQPVTGAYLNVKPLQKNAAEGTCDLELSGSIISSLPNAQVKFVYVDDKGKQSDVKTVTTESNGDVTFKHNYPAGTGQKSGKIRIVGQSHAFFSNWSDYETDCKKSPGGKVAVLPPKAVAVEAYALPENVMYRGRLCPEKVKVWGVMKGRGDVDGGYAILGDGKLVVLGLYQAEDGKDIIVQGEHTLSWEGNQTGQQSVHYRMNVTNSVGDLVDHVEKSWGFECKKPQVAAQFDNAPGGIVSNDNLPKSVTLSVSTLGQKKLPGYVCPEKARLHGNVMSDDQPLTGKAILYASGSLVAEHDVDLQANWGHNYDGEHTFAWNAATQTEQTMLFTLKFVNQHGHVVKTVEKTESFACQKIVVNPAVAGGPGGIVTEQSNPLPSQQQGAKVATGQLVMVPPMNIMAPKGRVHSGDIRLSGGKPGATYKLTFLRRKGGGYTVVNAAKLPKQMKGANASFPLAALTGGRAWRLKVCPLGAAASACKTSDFRIPAVGAKTGGQQTTPPPATVIIVPGAMNQN